MIEKQFESQPELLQEQEKGGVTPQETTLAKQEKMSLHEWLDRLDAGETVIAGSALHQMMHAVSQEAVRLCMEINGSYHEPAELRALFGQLIGKPVPDDFGLSPPFNTDCGKNITVGRGVFINAGCKFQDQGGIVIGDHALIGHNVVLATLNHDHPHSGWFALGV